MPDTTTTTTTTSTPAGTTVVTTAPAVTPGYKTSEFWFSVVALVMTVCFASGFIKTGSTLDTVLGIVASVLSSLGYTVGRSMVKANQ